MITEPGKFKDAIDFIAKKDVVTESGWDEEDWNIEETEVAKRAFWSSKVENARFLQRAKKFIEDRLANTVEDVTMPDGTTTTRLVAGGRGDFVRAMREFMVKEGMASEDDFRDAEGVTDIRSETRLGLIYNTNLQMAYGYGQWKEGNAPINLYLFPAQEFFRSVQVIEPRERHEESIGEIRLKTDYEYWADYQNDPEIGGFGVPWPPFGFNSGMNVRDVSRKKAEEAGLDVSGIQLKPKNLNEDLKASVKTMDEDLREKLRVELNKGLRDFEFKGKVTYRDDDFILDEQKFDNLFYDGMITVLAEAAPMMGLALWQRLTRQLEVKRIIKGSAAAKAGLKKGDVLYSVGGKKLKKQKDLLKAFEGRKPRDKVEVEVKRGNKRVKVNLTLDAVKGIVE